MNKDDDNCTHCEILALRDKITAKGQVVLAEGNHKGSSRMLAVAMLLNAAASVCEEDDNTAMDAIQNAVKVMDMSTNQEEDCGGCDDCPAADICPIKGEGSDQPTPVAKDGKLLN